MIAKARLQATVDGVQYDIPVGAIVPPELVKFYTDNGAVGVFEKETPKYSTDNATVMKGK